MLIHDRGYLIAARPGGTFTFYQPDGTPLPTSPALPTPSGTIQDCHDADITPDTIIPPGTASASTWTTPSTPASPTPTTKPATATAKTGAEQQTRTAPPPNPPATARPR